MGHEERVDAAEDRAQRRRADLAERVAQVHPAAPVAAEAEPFADKQGRVDPRGAAAVLRAPATTTAIPAPAAPIPRSATVRRRSGEAHSAPPRQREAEERQDDREQADRSCGVREGAPS